LKQNIQICDCVETSMLDGLSADVVFEWKSEANGTGTKFRTLLLQEVRIIPEIVSTDLNWNSWS